MIYRPTRERDIEDLKEAARIMLKNTGHEEISLSSLSSSDYSELKELVNFLIDEFRDKAVNISLPVSYTHLDVYKRQEYGSDHHYISKRFRFRQNPGAWPWSR